jgi:hypothetical protein
MNRHKYPRTPHLPWSLGATDDDKRLSNVDHFVDKEIVVTEKMDGENTTMYSDYIHARSIDSKYHPSRGWVKNLHATIAHSIPENMRICGENLYAQHSINYKDLPSYFMVFAIFDNVCCYDWDSTKAWAKLLGLETVPEIYRGVWNEKLIKSLWSEDSGTEGYVVRLTKPFYPSDFEKSVAKFVRPNHVQTDTHWMHQTIVKNGLKNEN